MKHPETKRLVPGAKYAVLFIHGIVGTPNHFRKAVDLEALVPQDWSCRNLLLPGHGQGVKEFAESSGKQWGAYVRDEFLELAETHEAVLIAGHSMGTLFALQLAEEYPEKVCGLFLLNVPLRPWLRLWGIANCIRLALGRVRTRIPREEAILTACGAEPTKCLWRYLTWIPRFLDLFGQISRTESSLTEPEMPYQIIHSRKDELVSDRTVPALRRKGLVQLKELEYSTHFYYIPGEKEEIVTAFREMLCAISTKS